jgi:DNA polymerase-4
MVHLFGKFGETLYEFCRGIDERELEMNYERKSLGTEETFSKDLRNFDEMKSHVSRMVQEVRESLENYQDRQVKTLVVKIKYFDFKQTTIERQMPFSEENFLTLLEERWAFSARPVRLLGVGVKFLDSDADSQLPLLTEADILS